MRETRWPGCGGWEIACSYVRALRILHVGVYMGVVGREWELSITYKQRGARGCRVVCVHENLRAQKSRMLNARTR